jgi:hypothetical protein
MHYITIRDENNFPVYPCNECLSAKAELYA